MTMIQSITRLANGLLGVAANQFDGLKHEHRIGAVPSMSQGQTGTIWDIDDTIYPWSAFASATTLTVDRASASDADKLALLEGLDENYYPVSEEVTLTSATGNATSQSFIRLLAVHMTDGSSTNVGDVTVKASTTPVGRIKAGRGMAMMGIYTVPAGYSAYLLKGVATCQSGADATGDMFVRYGGEE